MSRVFVVHIIKTELVNENDDFDTLKDMNDEYCDYAFTSEDEADDFVETVTGYNPKYMSIMYGKWSRRRDKDGNVWSIMYDRPYELNPTKIRLFKREVLDF